MTRRKPNTGKSSVVNLCKRLNALEHNKSVKLEKSEEFPRDNHSNIFVRNQINRGKLAKLSKRQRGKVKSVTSHTITLQKDGKEMVLSKREVAKVPDMRDQNKELRKTYEEHKNVPMDQAKEITGKKPQTLLELHKIPPQKDRIQRGKIDSWIQKEPYVDPRCIKQVS